MAGLGAIAVRFGRSDDSSGLFSAAQEIIREVRGTLRPGDGFLLSTDLEKSPRQLMLAYDDPLGSLPLSI